MKVYIGLFFCFFLALNSLFSVPITPVAVVAESPNFHPTFTSASAIDGDTANFALHSPGQSGFLVYDLGERHEVTSVTSFARAACGGCHAHPTNVDFYFFADDDFSNNLDPSNIEGDADIVLIQNHSFSDLNTAANPSNSFETVVFSSPVTTRFIGERVNTAEFNDFDNFQIGEIVFEGELAPSLVPEPTNAFLFLLASFFCWGTFLKKI